MITLYESDNFAVVHTLHASDSEDGPEQGSVTLIQQGFEILDKRAGKGIYLKGDWAEIFQAHISAWQQDSPTQQEVEDTLEGYARLAQNPMVLH